MRDKSFRDVVQVLSCQRSARNPVLLQGAGQEARRRLQEDAYFEVVKEGLDYIHVGNLGEPIVHLDVDVRI